MHNFKCCYLNYYIVIFVIINISILLLCVEYRYYFYLNFVSYRYTITHFLVAKDLLSITFEIARHLQEQQKWRNWSRILTIMFIAVKCTFFVPSFFFFLIFFLQQQTTSNAQNKCVHCCPLLKINKQDDEESHYLTQEFKNHIS